MGAFTFSIEIDPRYRDLDPNNHVNHAVYASYLEQARTEYWEAVLDEPLAEAGVAIVSLSIEYEAELGLDDRVTVAMRVDPPGTSSLPQAYEIRGNDGVAATAEAVMVAFDRDAREARPVPDAWRDQIGRYEAANGNPWPSS